MKRLILITLINVICLTIFFGCASAIRYDGPYEGRVIDADTGEPIEGVVILGVWNKAQWSPAGSTHRYYDAKETVTDKDGEFKIPGLGLIVLRNIESMNVLIFKAGYNFIGMGPWTSFKKSSFYRKKVKWKGKKAIIPLRKLTMEERRQSATFPPSPPHEAPKEKIKRMMEEIYKERKERGLD